MELVNKSRQGRCAPSQNCTHLHTIFHQIYNLLRHTIILCATKNKTAAIKRGHAKDRETGGNFREGEREKPDTSSVRKGSISHSGLEIFYVSISSYLSFCFK